MYQAACEMFDITFELTGEIKPRLVSVFCMCGRLGSRWVLMSGFPTNAIDTNRYIYLNSVLITLNWFKTCFYNR